jgi:hypothetical protein
MKTRRKTLALVAVVALAATAGLWFHGRTPSLKSRFTKIAAGMSQAEVEQVMGMPSGNYETGQSSWSAIRTFGEYTDGPIASSEIWLFDVASITVYFDGNGGVNGKSWTGDAQSTGFEWIDQTCFELTAPARGGFPGD